MEVAQLLLTEGADVNAAQVSGRRPLDCALGCGHLDMVQFLLDAGADVNYADWNGLTPLLLACFGGNEQAVGLLLAEGAQIDVRDCTGGTVLHLTSGAELTELLIARGADPNVQDNDGRTPLHYAVEGDDIGRARALLDDGAAVDLVDKWGDTALDDALKDGDQEMIALLREHGAKQSAGD